MLISSKTVFYPFEMDGNDIHIIPRLVLIKNPNQKNAVHKNTSKLDV